MHDQDGSYNWPEYEGAYWTEEDYSIGYFKRHDGSPKWGLTFRDSDYETIEASSAAGLAGNMREWARRFIEAADEVEGLVPDIPPMKKRSYTFPFEKALLDELRPVNVLKGLHKP